MMQTSFSLLAPGGTLVVYSLISQMGGTGNVMVPFVKALSRIALWNVLPNRRRGTFYDLWAGHKTRPARFREHLDGDLTTIFRLLQAGEISSNIAARFPLVEASAALALAESRTLNGKVILLP